MSIPLLPPFPVGFPHPDQAIDGGLLAAGGDLSPEWLLCAYAHGIFPWFERDDEPIFWWSPPIRAVIAPGSVRITRSLRKNLFNRGYRVSFDRAFDAVVDACAAPRRDAQGTWITSRMQQAYGALHELGYAHSVEVWQGQDLVGGLYGVSLGKMFFGESMFAAASDASKSAFVALHRQLQRWRFSLIDCQISNPHLQSLGVTEMPRTEFLERLKETREQVTRQGQWTCDEDIAQLMRSAIESP